METVLDSLKFQTDPLPQFQRSTTHFLSCTGILEHTASINAEVFAAAMNDFLALLELQHEPNSGERIPSSRLSRS